MKLALRLGKTLAELDESMTAREFYMWVGFDKISPIGDERLDIHSAQISSSVLASQGAKVSISDCLIKFNEEDKDSGDVLEQLESLFNKMAE